MKRTKWGGTHSVECLEARLLLAFDYEGLRINEIVAAPQENLETRLRDEPDDRFRGDRFTPDWIELHNASGSRIDLSSVFLTDDPKHLDRWQFPDGASIDPNEYLVVLASGHNITDRRLDESEHWHADFKLDADGEYLALFDSSGTVIDSLTDYPSLRADMAFGLDSTGQSALLASPTPGARNARGLAGQVADVEFSVSRGFFSEPFTVTLSTPTRAAEIRYTIDGSEPTATSGMIYSEPIAISTTANLRAAAFLSDYWPSTVETQTYLFINDVIHQPAEIDGFPHGGRVWAGQNTYVPQDTEMDPEIVNDPAYAEIIDDSLLAIPTLSITSPQDTIFGESGWYDGEDLEGAVSVELLYPDEPAANQQIDAGIESHSHDRLKRSLRLNFREEYGHSVFETDYFQRSPVTGDSATDQFNAIILRGGNNRSWARIWNPDKTAYAIDEFYRSSQVAMSGYGMRGQVAHLYINGVYWGLYNPVERADDVFGENYFGGEADDWFTMNHGGDLSGNDDRWDTLRRMSRDDQTVQENYERLQQHLDLEAFVDYLILSWWTAVSDWPQNNFYGMNRNESANLDATPFQYVAWDGEWSWGQGGQSSRDGQAHVHPDFRARRRGSNTISSLWHAARENDEFMTLFHDRVFQHLFRDGALTERNAQARWTALTEMVREAVVAESARWGDSLESARQPTRTRDRDWQREVDRIRRLIDGNNDAFLEALRREEFYPEVNPPIMLIDGSETYGGSASRGTRIAFSAGDQAGTIYVGLDGQDPRRPGGDVSADARPLSEGEDIVIDRSMSILARVFDGQQWSALNRSHFTLDEEPPIQITEFDFNPREPNADELSAGLTNNDMFEFIEVTNVSEHVADLYQYRFDDGVTFEFPDVSLNPGEVGVIARNTKAFQFRFSSSIRVLGQYPGSSLSNGGERVTLVNPSGAAVNDLDYDDGGRWPGADGNGHSVQLRSLLAPRDQASSWIAAPPTPGQPFGDPNDLDRNGVVDAHDVDFLCAQIAEQTAMADIDRNGSVNSDDLAHFVTDRLGTAMGDANLDGRFDSSDLVAVFQAGQYHDATPGNSGWSEGDWNCDGDFTSADLVAAFQENAFVRRSHPP